MSTSRNIKTQVFDSIKALLEDKSISVTDDTELIGGESLLDSMMLVELCVQHV